MRPRVYFWNNLSWEPALSGFMQDNFLVLFIGCLYFATCTPTIFEWYRAGFFAYAGKLFMSPHSPEKFFSQKRKGLMHGSFSTPNRLQACSLARTPVLHVSVLQDHYRPQSPSFLMSCFHHPTLSDLRRTRFESEGSPWNILSPTMWLPMMDRLIWLQLCHLIAMAAPPALYQEVSHPTPLIQPSQES